MRSASKAARLTLLLALAASAEARAEAPAIEQRAKALFDEGRELVMNQQYERGCAKFEQSLRLASGIGTTYNLAACEVKLGHFARAYRLFIEAAVAARQAGQGERARVAEADAQALEPRLARIQVQLEYPEPELQVRLDGERLVVDAESATALCDPGVHRLVVSSQRTSTWTHKFEAEAGSAITIIVPRRRSGLAREMAPTPRATTVVGPGDAASTRAFSPLPRDERAASDSVPALTWVLGAGGVVGLASGAVFGASFLAQNADAKRICPSSHDCTQSEMAEHAEQAASARRARNASYLSFGAGASLLAAAGVVYWARPSRTSSARPLFVAAAAPGANGSAWAVELHGEF